MVSGPDLLPPPAWRRVIGLRIDAVDYAAAVAAVLARARAGVGGHLCAANVHMAVLAHDDAVFRAAVEAAFLVVPDGQPVRWALGWLGLPLAERVYGPELAHRVLAAAAREGLPVAFYGGREEWQAPLLARLRERHPGLVVAWCHAPPFRPATPEEDAAAMTALAGARIVLVGLGCPKQERWMAARSHRLPGVLLGVGAFFDLAAGRTRSAPAWMGRCGLEWLHRLLGEPRRLAGRFLRTNPRFVWLLARQLLARQR